MTLISDLGICNNSLSLLGAAPITSLTDETTERARLCNRLYASVRDNLLQEHKWNFAMTRVALARTSTVPVFGYSYTYQLPVDYLQLEEVYPADMDYRIEKGGLLLTSESSVSILYVQAITDPTVFSPKFRSALEFRMATLMAIPLTGDAKKASLMEALFDQTMGLGKSLDSKADPVLEYRADNILEARW